MIFYSIAEMSTRRIVDLAAINMEKSKDEVQLKDIEKKVKQYMRFIVAKISVVIILIIVYNIWKKFNSTPTFTEIELDYRQQPIDFPSVFICLKDPIDYGKLEKFVAQSTNGSREILSQCLVNLAQFSIKRTLNESCTVLEEYFPDFNIEEVLNQILMTCENYIFNCTLKNDPIACCNTMFPIRTEKGRCFVVNNFNTNFNTSPLQIWPYAEDGWRINFNTPNIEDDIDVYLKGFYDTLSAHDRFGFYWQHNCISLIYLDVFRNLSTSDMRELPLEHRQCLYPDERRHFLKPYDRGYNHNHCINECHLQAFLKVCDCVPLFYQDIPFLVKEGYTDCNLTQSMCVKDNAEKVIHRSCNCPKKCDFVDYYIVHVTRMLKTAQVSDLTKTGLVLYMKGLPLKQFKTHVDSDWNKITLPYGGLMGIYLGFIFFFNIEFIYRLLFRFCCTLWMSMRFRKIGPDSIAMDSNISRIACSENHVECLNVMDASESK